MKNGGVAVFVLVALSVWAAMHLYVFWRLGSLPWLARVPRRAVFYTGLALWAGYPLARILVARHWDGVAVPLEFFAANWIGVLFLLLALLAIADIVTLGGVLLPRWTPALRTGAVVTALGLAGVALVQGLRPPVVRDYEVALPGLPAERDGLVLVEISDVHLGSLIGESWLRRLVQRIAGLRPDVVVVVGDLVDGADGHVQPLLPVLKELRAPLGVWAVMGNHEFYSGIDRCVALCDAAGYRVLRDRCAEIAPGLVLAGVDDLTARGETDEGGDPVRRTLAGRPPGAAILLSHSPLQARAAAAAGAGLMLSGHTHDGQLWPFNYAVRLRYSLLGGRYDVDGMTAIVCRGTGTWGPRMRLWLPGEIVRIRLRSPAK
jgi:predicted MPP superfamily phosphohydrolase